MRKAVAIGSRLAGSRLVRKPLLPMLAAGATAMVLAPETASAQYTWKTTSPFNANGTFTFSDGNNWQGDIAPPASTSDFVNILNANARMTLNFTSDQSLLGGFTFARRGASTINLGTLADPKSLTVQGTFLISAASGSTPTFNFGTVNLGTGTGAATEAVWNIYTQDAAANGQSVTFASGTTVNFTNVGTFSIGSLIGNTTAGATLNLAAATVNSSAGSNTLVVKGATTLGRYGSLTNGVASNRGGEGTLVLPSALTSVSFASLTMGESLSSAGSGLKSRAHGVLDFGGGSVSKTFTLGTDLIMGKGDNVSGSIINPSSNLATVIGSNSVRGVIQLGYKDRRQTGVTDGADNSAVGTFVATGGSFSAYATELRIGHNTQTAGSASGTLDLSLAALNTLDVNTNGIIVGKGVNATGILKLGDGDGSSISLTVGSTDAGASGLLELHETILSIAGATDIAGPDSTRKGTVNTFVDGDDAGLDLAAASTLNMGTESLMNIVFESDPSDVSPGSIYWGMRWAGDHVAALQALETAGKLTWDDSALTVGSADIFKDGSFTYVGVAIPIPEPTGIGLLGLVGLAATRRRKHS